MAYTPAHVHIVASNAIGQAQGLSSSIRTLARNIDLTSQTDRADLTKALEKLTCAVAQLSEANRRRLAGG